MKINNNRNKTTTATTSFDNNHNNKNRRKSDNQNNCVEFNRPHSLFVIIFGSCAYGLHVCTPYETIYVRASVYVYYTSQVNEVENQLSNVA